MSSAPARPAVLRLRQQGCVGKDDDVAGPLPYDPTFRSAGHGPAAGKDQARSSRYILGERHGAALSRTGQPLVITLPPSKAASVPAASISTQMHSSGFPPETATEARFSWIDCMPPTWQARGVVRWPVLNRDCDMSLLRSLSRSARFRGKHSRPAVPSARLTETSPVASVFRARHFPEPGTIYYGR